MQAYVVKQISTSVQFLHRVVVHPHLLETRPLFTTYFNEKGEHGFLLRDAMHNADYAIGRCLSVCHVLVFCQNGYTYPQTFHCWVTTPF